jgi:hypothetical protein
VNDRTDVRTVVREHALLIASATIYIAAFTMYGVIAESRLTIAYAVIVVLAGLLVTALHVRVGFSRGVLWALALWGLLHMAGGLIEFENDSVLYNVDLGLGPIRYDRLVHAFGFGTAAVASWQAMRNRLAVTPGTVAGVIAALAGMGVGALNEVVEFIMSQTMETNVGGYENTGFDLIANTIGCTIAGVWVARRRA